MIKNILCYGDSNTWGYVPGTFDLTTGYRERYSEQQRWTALLQTHLGDLYQIHEEGLGARTTNIEDPDRPGRNGASFLKICLETHAPLYLVTLMLGTNDLNVKFKRSLNNIVSGIEELISITKNSYSGLDMLSSPKILIVFPPHPCHERGFDGQFRESIERSKQLVNLYQTTARVHDCYFLNLAKAVSVSPIDGIHLDIDGHQIVSQMVAKKIAEIAA